jgi:hypothetical protein
VYVCPFAGHVYEAPAQIDVLTLPVVVAGVTVKFKVAVLQPEVKVSPDWAVVYVCPFAGHTYDSPAQIDVLTLPVVVTGVTVKFKVAVLQPVTTVTPD